MDYNQAQSVLAKTLPPPLAALKIQTTPITEKYRLADLMIDRNLSFEEQKTATQTIRPNGDSIRFNRSVPVKGLITDPMYQDADASHPEKYPARGVQLYPISVWVDGVVRWGDLMVVAARSRGVDTLDVEIVVSSSEEGRGVPAAGS